MKERKAIIFDFDGTLVNSAPGIMETIGTLMQEMGKAALTEEQMRACVGPPIHQFFPQMLRILPEEMDDAVTRYRRIFKENALAKLHIFDGIAELLSDLKKRGLLLGIATCKLRSTTISQLKTLGIFDYFDEVSGADPDRNLFEKADILREAVSNLQVQPEEALMVGDRKYDLIGANAHRVPAIGVLYGGCGTEEELLEHHPLHIAKDVPHLRQLLLEA